MARVDPKLVFQGRRAVPLSLLVAALGWLGVAIGLWRAPSTTYFAYLTAFAFVVSIAVSALILLMIQYLVGARWSIVIRRLNEGVVSAIPVLAVLFAPIALGLPRIYVWAAPAPDLPEHALELLRHKRPYLNGPFFVVRAALYFVIWSAAGWVLCRGSLAQDRAAGPRAAASGETARRASAGLLPFVALGLTFAAFDWLMSLQPLWFSSIFGVYYFAGGFVASFGLLALLAFVSERSGMTPGVIRPPHFHALGRLMFGFSIFWAYNAFFQFMLIQIANRPEEVEFYVHRLTHGWDVVAALLVVARFLVPFALLLPRAIKFRGSILAGVGVLLLVGHYIDMYWLVVPIHRAQSAFPTIWEPCALAAVAGTAVAYAVIRQRGRPVVPIGDPLLPESIEYRSPT